MTSSSTTLRLHRLGHRQADLAVGRLAGHEALALQVARDQLAGAGVVVDDQHAVADRRQRIGAALLDRGFGRLLGQLGRDADGEGRALALLALHVHLAAEELDEGAGDGQAEPGAAVAPVVEASACTKRWNKLASASGAMPMPLSCDREFEPVGACRARNVGRAG